ncbi:hypothetical protein [Streptacidiphilus jiangxiensis]|uniref:Uncharacterized protein n=1 Tax=Streptacidiphilus jiangxiensis TaxID=235985 RepID=A0A1H7ZH43_STRJI|nr:hypothetical protein [Streptacidiphilus jiangxiensis]SEM57625.1 hypothetical protein SAMN05414137_13522 [Streptacidiphilus jiangxiensis]
MSDGPFGPQVLRTDPSPGYGATTSLSSMAYRDGDFQQLIDLHPETKSKAGRIKLLSPNLGEAFCESLIRRTLGAKRKPIVPSYGVQPRIVVEHALEAEDVRHQRDKQLTLVSAVFGLLFLPGTLLWLIVFELARRAPEKSRELTQNAGIVVVVLIAALLAWRPGSVTGFWGLYLRVMTIVPLVGWYVSRRICLNTAEKLRARWNGLLEGTAMGPTVPGAVPKGPDDHKAENQRQRLAEMLAEQDTNIGHYAGPKGILGLGPRWASWSLAEQLTPAEGHAEIRPFHNNDVVRKIEEHLHRFGRSAVDKGGIPHVMVDHWVLLPIGESADEISRPSGPDMDGHRMRPFSVTELADKQTFGQGPRHYVGAQFVLWNGQLVITLMATVTVLHNTLRIEVTGHALGPVHGLFTKKAAPPEKTVAKTGKFWEERTITLPIVTNAEVVRLATRAPFTWSQGLLNYLGGSVKLPEPFGLRHAWATRPWGHRFMADDAIRVATPFLRACHAATMELLADHDVDLERFQARSLMLSGEVQSIRPGKADVYDAD